MTRRGASQAIGQKMRLQGITLLMVLSSFLATITSVGAGAGAGVVAFVLHSDPQRYESSKNGNGAVATPILTSTRRIATTSFPALHMSLKPAAVPLMDSGKALARSGELLIELTSDMELYGGALSASGALIRNSGDALAQAAALCRFKTGSESACDEIREAATCLTEARDKLNLAIQEADIDKDAGLVQKLQPMAQTMAIAGTTLEAAGRGIMMRSPLTEIGGKLADCGKEFQVLSTQILELSPDASKGQISSQRMAYAAEKMIEAGNELMGATKEKAKGKGWLKG